MSDCLPIFLLFKNSGKQNGKLYSHVQPRLQGIQKRDLMVKILNGLPNFAQHIKILFYPNLRQQLRRRPQGGRALRSQWCRRVPREAEPQPRSRSVELALAWSQAERASGGRRPRGAGRAAARRPGGRLHRALRQLRGRTAPRRSRWAPPPRSSPPRPPRQPPPRAQGRMAAARSRLPRRPAELKTPRRPPPARQ